MRIAFIYDAVAPWVTGGVERRIWEVAKRLADSNDVHWYGLHYWDGPEVVERDGVTLHGVANPRPLYTEGRRSITEALSYAASLVRPLQRDQFDVIDCQEFPYFPAFPAKLGAVRGSSTLFLTWHEVWGDYWYEYLGRKGVFGKLVERSVARLPDAHVAVSERTRRDVHSLGPREIEVVPNGIDRDTIDQVEPADEPIEVLFVGRLIKEKNVPLLVEAFDRLRADDQAIRCVIVGDGPERERIRSSIDVHGLSGHVDLRAPLEGHEEILGLMKAADVFVLPSRREGFGMTVLEALACGTPAVTIHHPQNAAAELIDDGTTGVVCQPTASALAAGIERARTEATSEACVDATRPYEWSRIVDQLESLYHEAATSRSPDP